MLPFRRMTRFTFVSFVVAAVIVVHDRIDYVLCSLNHYSYHVLVCVSSSEPVQERDRNRKIVTVELYVRLCQRVVISILFVFPVRKLSIVHLFNNYTNVFVLFVLFNNCMCRRQLWFESLIEWFFSSFFCFYCTNKSIQ